MVGWFDPPVVLTKGYTKDAFIEGPLYKAMSEGAFLFINELNRMPEGTQNVLLPAMDEGKIVVPRIGTVIAKDGFAIIATQNPEEYIGTSRLSEALKDRFVWIRLDYQSEKEEVAIVKKETGSTDDLLVSAAVKIARKTRETPDLRRGASVRGAIDIVSIAQQAISEPLSELKPEMMRKVIEISTVMSLSSKIEQRESSHEKLMETLTKIVDNVLKELRLIAAPGIIEPSDAEGHSRNF
jgi:MoxR-like ATPase